MKERLKTGSRAYRISENQKAAICPFILFNFYFKIYFPESVRDGCTLSHKRNFGEREEGVFLRLVSSLFLYLLALFTFMIVFLFYLPSQRRY